MSPEVTTTYKVQFLNSQCSATDTIQVLVVDPNSVDCNQVFFPTAFTPNDDGLNDSYGISNPYAIKDLISFEIYDKWGGNVFKTTDPFAVWDGKSNGSPLNPGVFLYRVAYRCNNEEKILRGSFTLLK
ncbi:MAG: gliding motility-associated C-terminal domain-containing protein [Saprospiraceae bacterium]|nr:gliding motility-associated C-terminal domain-containing protein [Saprospiraceae bacterium]